MDRHPEMLHSPSMNHWVNPAGICALLVQDQTQEHSPDQTDSRIKPLTQGDLQMRTANHEGAKYLEALGFLLPEIWKAMPKLTGTTHPQMAKAAREWNQIRYAHTVVRISHR